jgi:FSR family fosmidomycin resistance protein-like MFS transporter
MKQFDKAKVYTISSAHFAHDIFSSFLAPLLPLIINKLNISLSEVAFLDIIRRTPALFNPLLGLVAEKQDVKYFLIFTPAITAISMSLLGVASSYFILILLLFVAGISSALFHIPSPTMIKQSSGDDTGKGMSYFMVGGEFARTLGPIVVTSAVSWWGLGGTIWLMPIGIVASIVLYFRLKDFDTSITAKRFEKGSVKSLLIDQKIFLILLASFILFNATLKSLLTLYLPLFLVQHNMSVLEAGTALSMLQFFGVIGVFFSGKISDKIGRYKTLLISSISTVMLMGVFLYSNSLIVLALLGLVVFAPAPVLMAMVQDTNTSMPTFMHSIYMGINFGLSSIVVLFIGYLGDTIGLDKTFVVCNILGSGAFVVAFLMMKFRKQDGKMAKS